MSVALVGCKSKNDDLAGNAKMFLSLPNGATVNTVSYTISGNGITPIMGTVDVSGVGGKVSFVVSGIPQGNNYLVKLDAVSTDGSTTCGGQANFNITAKQTTQATVVLQCGGNNTGSLQVNGVWCPQASSFSASPLVVGVGGTINVSAAAIDLDPSDDATVTFAWSATAGTFAAANMATTTYTCSAAGQQTLTIKVSATSPTVDVTACNDSNTITVTCVPISCGNGTLDPGEECDPPNGTTCDANCLQIPVCGNGVVEAPVGPYMAEQCDPPNGTTCSATCQNIAIVCGNGIVQPGEQCDPPNGTTCSPTCQNLAAPMCGDGVINQASEQCDPPAPATNFTPACTATCTIGVDSLCGQCETSKCDTFFAAPNAWGCASLTGTALTNCKALLACIRTNHCATASGDAQPCYCGTVSDALCLGGGGNGVCKTAYETAAGTTDFNVIIGGFVDPTTTFGLVDNQITCDGDTTTTPSCTTVCPL
jgi:cysteine-rich repeat protein